MTAYKSVLMAIAVFTMLSCKNKEKDEHSLNHAISDEAAHQLIDRWHSAAANADFETYFGMMADSAVFIGTDAHENWDKKAFQDYALPHFEKGKAWTFKTLQRNMYKGENLIWFDELLDTQMGLCRGSGVLKPEGNNWKIAHYVLSITIPNENVGEVIDVKQVSDSLLKARLKN